LCQWRDAAGDEAVINNLPNVKFAIKIRSLPMENKKPKIFGIGMFKTGTKTLGAALTKLGFRTLSGPWWPEEMINDPWYEQSERWTEYYDVIKSQVEKYDTFEDYPWMYLYEECDHWWPESKFILTIRDPDRVAVSDINMLKRRGVRRRPSRSAHWGRPREGRRPLVRRRREAVPGEPSR